MRIVLFLLRCLMRCKLSFDPFRKHVSLCNRKVFIHKDFIQKALLINVTKNLNTEQNNTL